MRLGVFSVFDTYPNIDPRRSLSRPESTLRLARSAERLGYDAFWAGEHHVRPSGSMPAPPVWLAAAARETNRIRLGALVSVLPLHAPRELAEQFALVDRLSEGRLEVGLGTGYDPLEYDALGRGFADRRTQFDASLPEFQRALSGGLMPTASGGSPPVGLNVRTVQRPHPPIWIAAARSEGITSVAGRGFGLALIPYATLGHVDELASRIALYRDHLAPGVEPRVLACFHVYAGAAPSDARVALQRFLDTRPIPPSPAYLDHLRQHPDLRTAEGLERNGLVWFDSAGRVADRLAALETAGVTDFAGIFDFGNLPDADVELSLARFMRATGRVQAAVRPDLVVGRALELGLTSPVESWP